MATREPFAWTWESFATHSPNASEPYWQRFYDDEPWWAGWRGGFMPDNIRNLEPLFRESDIKESPKSPSDGYQTAFYQIAEAMNISAQSMSPKTVFEQQMLPKIKEWANLSSTPVNAQLVEHIITELRKLGSIASTFTQLERDLTAIINWSAKPLYTKETRK
jgi:hypothetical protein